uniref:Uncharacterized protein n=1 Tax=Anguilla anguilla TaxID=7936 RepID=A0A0E9VT01_ANGAN
MPPSVPCASWSPRRRGRVWRRGHWGPPGGSANWLNTHWGKACPRCLSAGPL